MAETLRIPQKSHLATNSDAHLSVDKAIFEPGLIAWFEQRYDPLIAEALEYHEGLEPLRPAGSGRKGRKRRRPGHDLALRLRDFETETPRFPYDAGAAFTNNQAERDRRLMKHRVKISGASGSERCAQDFATLRSALSTARKRGRKLGSCDCNESCWERLSQLACRASARCRWFLSPLRRNH